MHADHQVTLNLHGLGKPPGHVPADERRYWLPVDFFVEILERFAHRDDVGLTFDDGNLTDAEIALPELAKRGLRAEFFVLAGRLDTPGYLGPRQVRALLEAGMTIGLHGMAHRSWASCDDAELDVEVDEAKRRIESVAGTRLLHAACPFGAYDAAALRRLRRAGFERVYTSDGGIARRDEWLQCRNTLQINHRIEDVQRLVEHPPTGLRDMRRRLRTFVKSKRGGLRS